MSRTSGPSVWPTCSPVAALIVWSFLRQAPAEMLQQRPDAPACSRCVSIRASRISVCRNTSHHLIAQHAKWLEGFDTIRLGKRQKLTTKVSLLESHTPEELLFLLHLDASLLEEALAAAEGRRPGQRQQNGEQHQAVARRQHHQRQVHAEEVHLEDLRPRERQHQHPCSAYQSVLLNGLCAG